MVVMFNYAAWAARYPEFGSGPNPVSAPLAQAYFDEACLYCANTDTARVPAPAPRATLLNMLTAHIAQLYRLQADGDAQSQLVGRIASATEGSVSVATENLYPPGSAQWYQQTKYGSSFWSAVAPYRSFIYQPQGPQYPVVPPYPPYPTWN